MNSLTLLMLLGLTILTGCSDDIPSSSSRTNTPTTTTTTPTVESDESPRSSIHRVRGNTVLSYLEEIKFTFANALPDTAYRIVPDMEIDDEGTDGVNISTQTSLGRPKTVCGAEGVFANVNARIEDCKIKNADKSLWSGTNNGASGEGDWRLVSFNDAGEEIWMDVRTKMLWSDVRKVESVTTFNWCQAAGNDQNATEKATIDCNATGAGISACHNVVLEGISTQVEWRLPTRNDFLQGDLDGLRYVLPTSGSTGYWTATMKANTLGRTEAWVYYGSGVLGTGNLTSSRQVRCIGTPVL